MLEAAVFCLAMNLYHESRGEPIEGQKMVAYVTMNRAMWDERLVCPTVFQDQQFSWANGKIVKVSRNHYRLDESLKPKERAAWTAAQNLARTVLMVGPPPERFEAKFYHATSVKPAWAKHMKRVAAVGRHIFYRL